MPNLLIKILLVVSSMVTVVGSISKNAETKENAMYTSIFLTNMAVIGVLMNVIGGE